MRPENVGYYMVIIGLSKPLGKTKKGFTDEGAKIERENISFVEILQ